MENEEIDKLCRQIYSNHRRALDLIWERVGTPASGLIGRIAQWIDDQPDQWVRIATKQKEVEFIPAGWVKLLPPVGRRKTFEPEQWMTVRLRAGGTRLRLFVLVCPTTDQTIRKKVVERLLQDKREFGFSTFFKRLTDDWTRIMSEEVCPLPEDEEIDVEAVMERVEKRMADFTKQTADLPAAIKAMFAT